MIVRWGNRPHECADYGPWRPDAYGLQHAEVSVRYLEPVELARVDRTSPNAGRPIAGILSATEVQERRMRGAEATRARYSHMHRGVSDDAVLAALSATGGNVRAAARMVALNPKSVYSRLATLDRLRLLPDDLADMIEARSPGRPRGGEAA